MTLHTGSRVYVDPDDDPVQRIGGRIIAEQVINTKTGARIFTVHWDDGDTTNEIAADITEVTL